MDNFDLKKYLAEGRLHESFDTVTKDDWVKMDSDEREFALLSAFKDPEDAWKHIDKEWEDLPSVTTSNMIKENKPLPNIEQFINDKDFMESFIANAEESYEHFGDFKNMFDVYEKEGLTEEQIGDLLEYCDENDLISY